MTFVPTFDLSVIHQRLSRLLVPGVIEDHDLERRIGRLEERFRVYVTTCPEPLWAPGLHVTAGMRAMAETYLPFAEIRRAFERLFAITMACTPILAASLVHNRDNWLDVLHQLDPLVPHPNPARLLRHMMADEEFRCRLLFALFLPRHYGCNFDRYPQQAAFLADWLVAHRERLGGRIRCLDAACGCGEGAYGLAALLLACGYPAGRASVAGTTLEPLELFAAAHGWFPHDRERQRQFRERVGPLLAAAGRPRIGFQREDLVSQPGDGKGYDVILCNGLLGGPMLHEVEPLGRAVAGLARRLSPRGILLAGDRFHEGWKRQVPKWQLEELLRRCGLQVLGVAEGVGGMKLEDGA